MGTLSAKYKIMTPIFVSNYKVVAIVSVWGPRNRYEEFQEYIGT